MTVLVLDEPLPGAALTLERPGAVRMPDERRSKRYRSSATARLARDRIAMKTQP